MAEELSPQELEQFKAMEAQEPAEKEAIEAEKISPAEPVEPIVEPKAEPKEVPLAALQEERERRKAAEATARQAELNQARLDERLKIINDRLNPPSPAKEIPDPDKDALGALRATTEEIKIFREFQQRQEQNAQQQNYAHEVMSRAGSAEAEFMKTAPDYGDASVFLKKSRVEELNALGMDPLKIQQTMIAETMQLADSALRQGKNPAEVVYTLAKSRGYTRNTQVVQAQPDGDVTKLANIAAGQKANTSLGNLNSTPSKPVLNGKDLLAMDDDQFSSWLDKLPTKERAKFLGS